jgi:hypothetical protein
MRRGPGIWHQSCVIDTGSPYPASQRRRQGTSRRGTRGREDRHPILAERLVSSCAPVAGAALVAPCRCGVIAGPPTSLVGDRRGAGAREVTPRPGRAATARDRYGTSRRPGTPSVGALPTGASRPCSPDRGDGTAPRARAVDEAGPQIRARRVRTLGWRAGFGRAVPGRGAGARATACAGLRSTSGAPSCPPAGGETRRRRDRGMAIGQRLSSLGGRNDPPGCPARVLSGARS